MLAAFRQTADIIGRTLTGILLFVWLSMALAPCVIANSVIANGLILDTEISSKSIALHEKMTDCVYCPSENNAVDNLTLCHNSPQLTADTLSLSIDSINAQSLILFEIPLTAPFIFAIQRQAIPLTDYTILYNTPSPLALSGILHI